MSVNKGLPHLYVVPEDDADRQIADGFVLHPNVDVRRVQVVPPAGGWSKVRDTFKEEYLPLLQQNMMTHVVLLIDFDGNPKGRRKKFDSCIPSIVQSRVFVIGPRENPEILRQSLGKGFEAIGQTLAEECDSENLDAWDHEQLQHNAEEQRRLFGSVKPFLFKTE